MPNSDPPDITRLQAGYAQVQAVDRVYFAGEWDWYVIASVSNRDSKLTVRYRTGQYGGDTIQNWVAAVEALDGAGEYVQQLLIVLSRHLT